MQSISNPSFTKPEASVSSPQQTDAGPYLDQAKCGARPSSYARVFQAAFRPIDQILYAFLTMYIRLIYKTRYILLASQKHKFFIEYIV